MPEATPTAPTAAPVAPPPSAVQTSDAAVATASLASKIAAADAAALAALKEKDPVAQPAPPAVEPPKPIDAAAGVPPVIPEPKMLSEIARRRNEARARLRTQPLPEPPPPEKVPEKQKPVDRPAERHPLDVYALAAEWGWRPEDVLRYVTEQVKQGKPLPAPVNRLAPVDNKVKELEAKLAEQDQRYNELMGQIQQAADDAERMGRESRTATLAQQMSLYVRQDAKKWPFINLEASRSPDHSLALGAMLAHAAGKPAARGLTPEALADRLEAKLKREAEIYRPLLGSQQPATQQPPASPATQPRPQPPQQSHQGPTTPTPPISTKARFRERQAEADRLALEAIQFKP